MNDTVDWYQKLFSYIFIINRSLKKLFAFGACVVKFPMLTASLPSPQTSFRGTVKLISWYEAPLKQTEIGLGWFWPSEFKAEGMPPKILDPAHHGWSWYGSPGSTSAGDRCQQLSEWLISSTEGDFHRLPSRNASGTNGTVQRFTKNVSGSSTLLVITKQ